MISSNNNNGTTKPTLADAYAAAQMLRDQSRHDDATLRLNWVDVFLRAYDEMRAAQRLLEELAPENVFREALDTYREASGREGAMHLKVVDDGILYHLGDADGGAPVDRYGTPTEWCETSQEAVLRALKRAAYRLGLPREESAPAAAAELAAMLMQAAAQAGELSEVDESA